MNKFLFGNARNAAMVVARIAILMALTVLAQYLTSSLGMQLLTGSLVNFFLLISVLLSGMIGGISVGIVTPVIATLLGINKVAVVMPFIMLSNAAYVAVFALIIYLLKLGTKQSEWQRILIMAGAMVAASIVKFLLMVLFARVLFPLFLVEPQLSKLIAAWGWVQLFAALIGGTVATALYYPLRAAKLFAYYEE